jgi:acetylornithine deacetylase/succinyl-diaminopimelate desuccinylase-like protein
VLIAVFEAVTLLLQNGFQPKRTVLLSFGFDEEWGGPQGARNLAKEVIRRYGENGLEFILDEGLREFDKTIDSFDFFCQLLFASSDARGFRDNVRVSCNR